MHHPGVGHGTGNVDAGGKEVSKFVFVFAAALAFALGAGRAGAQEKLPADFGSLDSYPVPIGAGSGAELDYCYRYSRRIWELVRGQPRNKVALEQVSTMAKQALGSKGAAEDLAEFRKYFGGTYKTRDEMAGLRFYSCAKHLKLPVEERHRRAAELCFGVLNLPSYVAALKESGRTSEQALETLKGTNPPSAHPGIEATVKLIYTKDEDDVDGLLKDTFLACLVRAGAQGAAK
jgi:hypothetical protein